MTTQTIHTQCLGCLQPSLPAPVLRRAASVTLLALSLTLVACSSAPQQPAWLQTSAVDYPASRYLSSVGEGKSRSTADDRALANLAKIFEVAVADSSIDFSEARVSTTGDSRVASNTLKASRFVSTEARQVLEGARIVEHWQAEDGGHYSLAVLDKAAAARRFRASVQRADQQTSELVAYASQQAPNPVAALSALEQARQLQQQRDNSNRDLAVVTGSGIRSPKSQGEIEALIRKGLSSLQFGAQAAQPDVLGAVQSAIASLGIQYRQDAPYQVWGALDTGPAQKLQGWYWLRGSMQLSLRHRDEAIATRRWPIKVSAIDELMVQQRARDQLSNDLSAQLYQLLVASGR